MAGSTCVQSARRGFEQQVDLVAVERQNVGLLEELAVEARQRLRAGRRKSRRCPSLPECGEQRHELVRVGLQGVEQLGEGAILLRQQADIFGKHREQAAREEAGDEFGVVADAFERLGDSAEAARQFRA